MTIFKKATDVGIEFTKGLLGGIYEGSDPEKLREAMLYRKEAVAHALYKYAEQLNWVCHHYPEQAENWERFLDKTLLEFGQMSFPIFPYSR